jgi:predicted alpha/beta superfamily hydrolase
MKHDDQSCQHLAKTLPVLDTDSQEYYPDIATHLVRSKHVRQTFKVQVALPVRRRGEVRRFPVIYCTDGNLTFDVLKGICYSMQMSGNPAGHCALVGIGYPGDSPAAGAVLRARDMTFPGYPQLCTSPPNLQGVLVAEPGAKDFYGADDFQQFLQQELVPLIDETYDTVVEERTYFGHSLGAGFGLYTMFTRSSLFQNYILSSPGLIYHGRSSAGIQYDDYDFALALVRQHIASSKHLRGMKVYLSVGSEEEFEPPLAQWRFTSSLYRLIALLKRSAIPGLELTTEVIEGESHMSVWPIAFIHGLRAVVGIRYREETAKSA